MPILGDLNSTNPIYLKAIREVLNEDQRINKQVVDLQKKQASMFMQSVVPQNTLINKATTDNMDALVAAFNKKAEEMNNTLILLKMSSIPGLGLAYDKYKDILEVFDIVNYYNNIVSLIKSPSLSQAEKSALQSKAATILPMINNVRLNYKLVINGIINSYKFQERVKPEKQNLHTTN